MLAGFCGCGPIKLALHTEALIIWNDSRTLSAASLGAPLCGIGEWPGEHAGGNNDYLDLITAASGFWSVRQRKVKSHCNSLNGGTCL